MVLVAPRKVGGLQKSAKNARKSRLQATVISLASLWTSKVLSKEKKEGVTDVEPHSPPDLQEGKLAFTGNLFSRETPGAEQQAMQNACWPRLL